MALPLDAVLKLVRVSGFDLIDERNIRDVNYTADKEGEAGGRREYSVAHHVKPELIRLPDTSGMYSFRYDPHYWLAKKTATEVSTGLPADRKEL
jgi:hypothetical protein